MALEDFKRIVEGLVPELELHLLSSGDVAPDPDPFVGVGPEA